MLMSLNKKWDHFKNIKRRKSWSFHNFSSYASMCFKFVMYIIFWIQKILPIDLISCGVSSIAHSSRSWHAQYAWVSLGKLYVSYCNITSHMGIYPGNLSCKVNFLTNLYKPKCFFVYTNRFFRVAVSLSYWVIVSINNWKVLDFVKSTNRGPVFITKNKRYIR